MLGSGGSWTGSGGGGGAVGGKFIRTTRFYEISSGTSGSVTLPGSSTVVLDDFGGTVDAVTAQMSGGRPTYDSAVDGGGAIITATFDSSGNYTLSSSPSAYPIALVYRVQQTLLDFDSTASDIVGSPQTVSGTQNLQSVTDAGASTTNPIEVRGITVGTSGGSSGSAIRVYKGVEADNEYLRYITQDDRNVRVFADNIGGDVNHQLPNGNGTYGLKVNNITFDKQGEAYLQSDQVDEGAVNLYFTDGRAQAAMSGLYESPLTISTGLTRSSNTITNNLSTGVSAGQNVIGGTTASTNLNLFSNNHATRGNINFGTLSTYSELNDRFGISTLTPSSKLEIKTDSIAVSQSDANGIFLRNSTSATAGVQQYSPPSVFRSNAWLTTTLASHTLDYRMFARPTGGTTAARGGFVIQQSLNGGAYSDAFETGQLVTNANDYFIKLGGSNILGIGGGVAQYYGSSGGHAFYNQSGSVAFASINGSGVFSLTPSALSGSSATSGLSLTQTWNTSGNPTLIFANVTNTASGASANLMDLQTSGTSRFKVAKDGAGTFFGNVTCNTVLASTSVRCGATGIHYWNTRSQMASPSDGVIQFANGAVTDFGRLQLGGSTSSFPAIKRSTTTIQAVLADDSGFAAVQSLYQRFGSGTPEAAVTAPIGAIYHRTDGGAGTSFYVKESGTGNTGWVAK